MQHEQVFIKRKEAPNNFPCLLKIKEEIFDVGNFIHHGPRARAQVPYSVLEFERRSNYQQRNKWNFALP